MDSLEVVLMLIICMLFNPGNCQVCPPDWIEDERSDSCYLFIHGENQKKSVHEAGVACMARQGYLLKVDSINELNWLMGQIRNLEGEHEWWSGLNNIENEDEWKWADGSPLKTDIITWGQGEPNNYAGLERCAEIWDYHFNDLSCSTRLNYICERPKNKPLLCDADRGWVHLHDYCYLYHNQTENWREANFICGQEDASLAVVGTADTQKALVGFDKNLSDMWIGLHAVPSGDKDFIWQWTDGSNLSDEDNAAFWDTSVTSGSKPSPVTNKCVQMMTVNEDPLSNWQVDDCFEAKPFLCQKPQGVCPPGSTQYQLSCYETVSTKLSWFLASDDCKLKGGSLLAINSGKEQAFINSMLRQIFQSGVHTTWLGISDNNNDAGPWFWSTGDALGSYTNWANSENQNTVGVQDCGFIYTDDLEGRWITADTCSRLHPYICESLAGTSPPILPTDAATFECESGWYLWESSCLLFTDQIASWNDARISCQSYEADLVEILDLENNNFVLSKVSSNSWIGLNDRQTEGVFVWLDDTKQSDFFYTNWNSEEPNNIHNEDCAGLLSVTEDAGGKWNDFNCEKKLSFVCQKAASTIAPQQKTNSQEKTTGKLKLDVTATKTTTTTTTTIPPNTKTTARVATKCGNFWEEDPNTDFCYLLRDEQLTWREAHRSCHQHGGNLLSINNIQEQFFISGLIRGRAVRSLTMWTGANDKTNEGGWSWVDESPMSFIYWASGEPTVDVTGEEDCAALFVRETTWGSFTCNTEAGYICKKFAGRTTTTMKPVPPTFPDGLFYGCPDGYEGFRSACFMVVREKKTWLEARTFCRQQGGDLASIVDEEDQNFIYSQLPKEVCYNMFHDDSSCTKWADSGECQKNPVWMATHCHHACNYCIHNCEDAHSTEQCRHWASVGECIKNHKWMLLNCAFSCGICDSAIYGGFWIGLNDEAMPMSYQWSDGSQVTYTNWARGEPEPSSERNQNCVSLYLQNGHWNDRDCAEKLPGFVCRQTKAVLPLASTADPQVSQGCFNDSVAYDASCYLFVDEPKNWDEADDICIKNGGHLATVHDRFVQSFLASQLYSKTGSYWIGLSGNASFHWLDGSEVSFTHWARNYPVNGMGDCVAMVVEQSFGFWETMPCLDEKPFICESQRLGFTRMPVETTTTMELPPCMDDWKEFEGYCYKIFSSKETWVKARENCRSLGGDLASLHSKENLQIVDDIIKTVPDLQYNSIWIGLNDRDLEKGFVWSDGSPTDYMAWMPGNPDDYLHTEDCVELVSYRHRFNDANCYRSKPYICKVKKGMFLNDTSPVQTPTEIPETCEQEDWLYFNKYCYFFSLRANFYFHKNWYEARDICRSAGSDLISFHSQDVKNFVLAETSKYANPASWIGLNELDLNGYGWSDGTPLDFLSWNSNEPNDNYGAEKCVAATASNGVWFDDHCSARYGFICRRKNGTSTTQAPPTTAPISGGCFEGFHQIGNKCFYVGGLGTQKPVDWISAREMCETFGKGYTIASITSPLEQAFITSIMCNVTSDLWIGLNSLRPDNKYTWQDNTRVSYTAWQVGQPVQYSGSWTNIPNMLRVVCTGMNFIGTTEIGKWANFVCASKKAYLCQGPTVEAIPVATPASEPCPAFYLHYQGSCYIFHTDPQNWTEASSVCQSAGDTLVSITNVFESSYIQVFTSDTDQPFWIGLSKLKGEKVFRWADNFPVKFTKWAEDQVISPERQCVSYVNGSWNALSCSQNYPFICKKSLSAVTITPSPQTTQTKDSGYCLNKYWKIFGDYCYYMSIRDSQAWSGANKICNLMGMELASLHSQSETSFIIQEVEKQLPADMTETFKKYGIKLWIGLRRAESGTYQWSDQSPIGYFDWHDNEPRKDGNNHSDCVEMTGISGQWSSLICTAERGYVCRAAKVKPSTTVTATTAEVKTTNYNFWSNEVFFPESQPMRQEKTSKSLSPGQVIGIVIGIIGAVIMITSIIIVVRHIRSSATYARTSQGFDNALYTTGNQSVFVKDNFDNPSTTESSFQ